MARLVDSCQCPDPIRGTLPEEFITHVQEGKKDLVDEWLSNNGDVNAATEGGHTLLSLACVYKSLGIVQRLLEESKIHLNTKHRIGILSRFTPLSIAANKGLSDIVSVLVARNTGECQLDVGVRTSKGTTAISLAAEKNHWDVVETLSQDMAIPKQDQSIVSSLARFAKKDHILDLLKKHQLMRTNRSEVNSIPASERIYKNDTSPRGLVLILNYIFKDDPLRERKGANEDANRLHRVFKDMNYKTEEICDPSYSYTLECLEELSKRDSLKAMSSLVVVVMSHGRNRNHFQTADAKLMKMNTLLGYFTDQNCPNLEGKPKIFSLQFCRGPDEAKQVNDYSGEAVYDEVREAFTDMICLYAAQEGFLSYRFEGRPNDPFTGTPFIKAFCQVLQDKGHLWLDDLVREFIDEYSNTEYGQPMDCHNIMFRRKFCFNPIN